MESLPFQHTNERILYRSRRSVLALFRALLRGFVQGIITGIVVGVVLAIIWSMFFREGAMNIAVASVIFFTVLLLLRTVRIFRATTITITTQRILIHGYDFLIGEGRIVKRHRSLFHALTHTVRWESFQESIYEGGVLGHLMNIGTLTIRHGTAEATRSIVIDLLPYAEDLKHYLDKIQSLRGAGAPDANMSTFVRARRGKRDRAVLTYV